ncbi:MAG: thioredoxin-dependent thiol peroxidase [Sporolactobacillus sp.]|jgi:peroxiredoxin Q/BCP|nr:thioredoxin-dependent thiol peroxidase [Sporolactobacillus sp.]
MLEAGVAAPDFTLESMEGEKVTLSDFHGKNVVLYFYPRDMTPGCTNEACDFRDQNERFAKVDTVVIGISPDSVEKHRKFIEKHHLPFTLLSDPNHEVSSQYGTWQKKKNFGREYMGMIRTTYLVDKKGVIANSWTKVKVSGHVDEVYRYVKEHLA